MEEIKIKDLLKYFRDKNLIILGITLLIVVLGTIFMCYFQTPKYKSYTTILLTKASSDEGTIDQTDVALNQKLVTTYSEIIKSRRIIKQVIDNLELDYSENEVIKNIKVTSVNNTEIIKIEVTDENAHLASNIANDIADVFSKEIKELYKIQNISIIDKAEVNENPSNINPLKEELIFTVIGLAIGLSVVFIKYYFDSSIKSIEDIENIIGLPVIGTVPLKTRKKVTKCKKN